MAGKILLVVLVGVVFYFLITPKLMAPIQAKISLMIKVYYPYLKEKLKDLFTKKN
jgi:hypothetical protein